MTGLSLEQHVYDLAGFLGTLFYLGSYTALQLGVIRGNGYVYATLNLFAASLVLLGLAAQFNLSVALLQICWITVSVIGILRIFLLTRTVRFNAEEKALIAEKLPRLSKIAARRFLDMGLWVDAPAGTRLMTEGERHGVLIYLASGTADVRASGTHVGTVGAGSFLGEMTVLQGEPATATVDLAEPSRYFRVEAEKLRDFGGRDAEFQLQLENALSLETRMKLVAANRRLWGQAQQHGAGG